MHLRGGVVLLSKVARVSLIALLVSGLGAQVSRTQLRTGYPEDWTHHHIKFSMEGLRQHPEIARSEPRAMHQLIRQWRAWHGSETLSAASSTGHPDWSVNLGAGKVAFGQYPAKWNSDPNVAPSCTNDFVVFALNVAGATGGQASLVAYNNLYRGASGVPLCGAGNPTVKFAYNTSIIGGTIVTSPVMSLDGTKLAFVESIGGGLPRSVLHILTIGTTGNNGTSPTISAAPGTGNNASLRSILYAGANNTQSSPWVDYATDTLYVGANNGRVYKITGVFQGTPALAGAPWPVLLQVGGATLTGGVLDPDAHIIYFGARNGILYSLDVSNPGASHTLAIGQAGQTNPGIFDSPIFDATGARVLVSSSNDGTSAVVVQAGLVQSGGVGVLTEFARVRIGRGSTAGTAINLYDGDFDNAYFNSPPTGHMLVCGTGAADNSPWRYSLGFDAGGILQPDPSPVQIVTNIGARCAPFTEYFNPNIAGGTDFFFWGVTSNCGIAPNPGRGCVMSLQNGTAQTPVAETGGTSGIIVDNDFFVASPNGAHTSSIYFTTQTAPFNGVKLTQLGLQ